MVSESNGFISSACPSYQSSSTAPVVTPSAVLTWITIAASSCSASCWTFSVSSFLLWSDRISNTSRAHLCRICNLSWRPSSSGYKVLYDQIAILSPATSSHVPLWVISPYSLLSSLDAWLPCFSGSWTTLMPSQLSDLNPDHQEPSFCGPATFCDTQISVRLAWASDIRSLQHCT